MRRCWRFIVRGIASSRSPARRGGGWGAFEAARLGKPVIMTGYGGQLDYLDAELSHLVDYTLVLGP